MKILLDENMPAKVKYDFGENFEIHTVKDMGWLGMKNGELLHLATINGFDIFLTLDKNLKYQQSINKFDLKFIVLLSVNNKHQTLQPYIEKVKDLLNSQRIPKLSEITLD
jgi:predicted nuclease of predicted toxin-antitoxin system